MKSSLKEPMKSNPAQTEAICHGDGPMLVLAGPGSGKTTVITNRVLYLLTRHGVPPEQLLVITFTKAAAQEMRQRFEHLSGQSCPSVTFGTFHAVFFQILRYAYNYSAASIIRESEAMELLTAILDELNPALSKDSELVLSVLQEIALFKGNHSGSFEQAKTAYLPKSCSAEVFFAAFQQYEKALRDRNRVDFEDMLLLTYELLTARRDILSFWQSRYRYILIDEFQDINRLQYEIIRLLAAPEDNLFIVGDDDQSVYGFRGSCPEIMLRFPTDYPNAKTVLLNVNYRSPEPVVQAALRLISANEKRYPKALTAFRTESEPVHIRSFETCADENQFLVQSIQALKRKQVPLSQIAVLYRTNLQPRSLVNALQRAELSYCLRGTLPCLYDSIHVLPVLSYLRLAAGSRARSDVLQIMNKPLRYLQRQAFPTETVDFEQAKQWYRRQEKEYAAERLERLQYDLSMLGGMNPYAAIHYIRKIIGYDKYLDDSLKLPEEAFDLLDEMLEESREFLIIPEFLAHAANVRAQYKENATRANRSKGGVALMTFHSCKGLEFPYVFVIDCNETLLPHKKSLLPEQICEERRLLYVAMTRAKEALYLCSVRKRFGKELPESRFLSEILLPRETFAPGTPVIHKAFGPGTVESLSGDRLVIRFQRLSLPKSLSLQFCMENRLLTPQAEAEA